MAGERCAPQSSRNRLTFARRRSVATSDFFVRKAEALKKACNRRVVDGDTFGIGKRVAQFKEREVRVLRHKLTEKTDMRGQLAGPRRSAHRRNLRNSGAPDLPRPPSAHGSRHLQSVRGLSPRQVFLDQTRKAIPSFLWQRCWHDPILQIRVNHRSDIKGTLPIQTFLKML